MKNPLTTPDASGETLGEAILAGIGCFILLPAAYYGIMAMLFEVMK
jgi:hypothetical protein